MFGESVYDLQNSTLTLSFTQDGQPSNGLIFEELDTLNLNSNVATKYPLLGVKKLRSRQVQYVQSDGNCCWKMFKKSHLRGETQPLSVGFEGKPNLQPMSASIFDCDALKRF